MKPKHLPITRWLLVAFVLVIVPLGSVIHSAPDSFISLASALVDGRPKPGDHPEPPAPPEPPPFPPGPIQEALCPDVTHTHESHHTSTVSCSEAILVAATQAVDSCLAELPPCASPSVSVVCLSVGFSLEITSVDCVEDGDWFFTTYTSSVTASCTRICK